jgi:hypothetical protein
MGEQNADHRAYLWVVARGFVVTAIITAVLAVPWVMVLGLMKQFAFLIILKVTAIYCVV